MVNVGVVGAKGFAGEELIKLLLKHPLVKITALADKMDGISQDITVVYPYLAGQIDLLCEELDIEKVAKKCDLVFLALPHKISQGIAADFIKAGKTVIDLSADFRIKDPKIYEQWYETKHMYPELLAQAVYGLPELYREQIKQAKLIANPGCYPTSIILGTAPLVRERLAGTEYILADSKSGISGAGRAFVQNFVTAEEKSENLKAYSIGIHRHTPEIEQELSNLAGKETMILFTPHLIPIMRGILSSIYIMPNSNFNTTELLELYKEFYKGEPFVRILPEGKFPETNEVVNTNYCNIGVKVDDRTKRIIIVSAIDNLIKGASGQAIQNMNIIFGFDEKAGLV
jgi:N-acetyl-gamma-glutamyl-phosphate reductase